MEYQWWNDLKVNLTFIKIYKKTMKLLRYETSTSGISGGEEKPGLLDEAGVLHDLSGIVDDIAAETLLPENIERLR